MEKSKIFTKEIALINDATLQRFTRYYLDNWTPDIFWTTGASASGKFHPDFAKGEGGLVRHTKAVVMFCDELMRMSQWAYMTDARKDIAIMACIFHDTCKYGMTNEVETSEYKNHAENAAINVEKAWNEYFDKWGNPNTQCPYELTQAIRSHMGQWSTNRDDRPFTPVDRLVHLADYVASRNFLSIPVLEDNGEDCPF